jgi:hypothetical protein
MDKTENTLPVEQVAQWCRGCSQVRSIECTRPDCPTAQRLAALASHPPSDAQVERVATAIWNTLNKDDLPEGGWKELMFDAGRAAIDALKDTSNGG